MLTAVIYKNGDSGLISADHLDELIAAGEIKQFLRLDGWTIIDVGPIRKELKVEYKGSERRQTFVSFQDDELVNIKLNI